jgi:hypothetical protein
MIFFFSAKMDATENDVPSGFDVQGFPTLYFVPKNSKDSPRRYDVNYFTILNKIIFNIFLFRVDEKLRILSNI